jgi:hypothetical protein
MRRTADGRFYRGRVFVSDDGGQTVRESGAHPLYQARPFVADRRLYILGHYDDLGVVYSEDDGETWSEVSRITKAQQWHQAPCNVHYARGRIYLVMERHTVPNRKFRPVFSIAPVVLSAPVDADLAKRDSWTFSNELTYRACVERIGGAIGIGVPFYSLGPTVKGKQDIASRPMAPPDRLPETRYYLPDNERHRLALHFSRNCVDWCFAGIVDKTDDPRQSRNYPSMAFDGDDLLVFARSGSAEAVNADDGDMLTLHRIRDFRVLVY